MSRIRILLGIGLIVTGIAFAPWGRAAEPGQAEPSDRLQAARYDALKASMSAQVKRLEAANAKLEEENRQLKNEIKDLKSRLPAVLPQLPPLRLAPAAPATPSIPKNAIPHEFNGETFYVVPLISGYATPVQHAHQNDWPASPTATRLAQPAAK